MSLESEALRGRQAQEVIDNPIYAEAFGAIEQEISGAWRAARDSQDREQLHQLLGLLEKVQTALESVMRTGEVATAELKRKATRAEQIQALVRPRAA
jgi:hypothetical protein